MLRGRALSPPHVLLIDESVVYIYIAPLYVGSNAVTHLASRYIYILHSGRLADAFIQSDLQ